LNSFSWCEFDLSELSKYYVCYFEYLNGFLLLPNDLNRIVLEYDQVQYDSKPIQIFHCTTSGYPLSIASDGSNLYICDLSPFSSILIYSLNGIKIERKSTPDLEEPSDIDLYENNLYIVDKRYVSIFTLQFSLITSFHILDNGYYNHLKVNDQNTILITFVGKDQVYIYNRNGKILRTIGSSYKSAKKGEFIDPRGLTLNKKFLYICDCGNNRIQSFHIHNYLWDKQWGTWGTDNGQFISPYSIYYCENIIYVGDKSSVQLFTEEGKFLQRLGDKKTGNSEGQFYYAWGVCVVIDKLYVSDRDNERIQVFQ